jgi:hypothetical protein
MSLAEIRRKGNANADTLIEKAKEIAKLLYKFPYVRPLVYQVCFKKFCG